MSHTISRRRFLQYLGLGFTAVAAGGVLRAVDQGVFSTGQGPAYEPWKTWANESEQSSLELVRAAILASNPHNTQPWKFKLSANGINLYADPARSLGAIDPFQRELYIGLGCALENLLLAASAEGYASNLKLFPDGNDPTLAAQIELTPAAPQINPLYNAIPIRHTNRAAYDLNRPIDSAALQQFEQWSNEPDVLLIWLSTAGQKEQFSQYTLQATDAIISDPQQSAASHAWWNQSWREIQKERAGLTLDAQGLDPLTNFMGKMLPDMSEAQNNAAWLKTMRQSTLPNTSVFGLLAVRDAKSNIQRIRAGQVWERIQLQAALSGIGMQPLNQIVERADREQAQGFDSVFGSALSSLTGNTGWQTIFSFRAGYPTQPGKPSPRRAVEDVLIS